MKFTFDGKNYLLKFSHVVYENNRKKMKQATIARLYEVTEEGKKEVATGVAECSSKDNFNKAYGREISMTRLALNDAVSPKLSEVLSHQYYTSGMRVMPDKDYRNLIEQAFSKN